MTRPSDITSASAHSVAEWFIANHAGQQLDPNNVDLTADLANVLAEYRTEARRRVVGLTPVQVKVLGFLTEQQEAGAAVPSFSEIGRACGITSSSGVHRIIHTLASAGAIRFEPGKARSIDVVGRA